MQPPKIFVQDDFFEHNFLKKIQQELVTTEFKSRYNDLSINDKKSLSPYQRTYHHVDLAQNTKVVQEVKVKIKDYFNIGNIQKMLFKFSKHTTNTSSRYRFI